MKQLFDELSYKISRDTTNKYSTSFSLGILALGTSIRKAVYAVYAYVRLADEIVDSFHDYDKAGLLKRFVTETDTALSEQISLNPILNAFQHTVLKYNIDRALIDRFLHSMKMDLHDRDYDRQLYDEYIYGSAEVVGLMCLQIFVNGNKSEYDRLKPYAMKLGSAFQKVNFLRDLQADYQVLGRSYFPDIDLTDFSESAKRQIETEIQQEFSDALIGIRLLPKNSRFGVYLAYKYYLCLFKKIRSMQPQSILQSRVRIHNGHKAVVMMKSYLRYKVALL